MTVCIAEKPSVARDIANVLGATDMKQGYIEGNGYQVTWTFGHLCELKEPGDYLPRWKRWDLWDLPILPDRFGIRLKNDEGVRRQFAVIETLMRSAESVVNCGDAGQEGELIQRWVMQKARATCPVRRLWISSLTDEAIREGFARLKDQADYQPLYEAGLCRAIGDWTLGINATRLYTLKYGRNRQVLSIGRVQTPTLALIVHRQQEIENFTPRQSWTLTTLYRNAKFTALTPDEETEGGDAAGKYKTLEFPTQEEGRTLLISIEKEPLEVTDVQKKRGSEAPPRLYDLTSLQVDCNRKFGYSAEQTLQLIQSLYEKKYTTYPRVDTTYLSEDIYAKCPQTLAGLKGYEAYTAPLAGKPLPKSKKVFDSSKVTDHHAIIPTGVPAMNLTDMERRVYDLVTRAFIAIFYPDCKFETTTVYGRVRPRPHGENGEAAAPTVPFRTSARVVISEGWKALYSDTHTPMEGPNSAESVDSRMADNAQRGGWPLLADNAQRVGWPVFKVGESGAHQPSLAERWTQPPKPYTEATLLRAMETAGRLVDDEETRDALKENGIGRPSTRAAIIETLFRRQYIRRERKNLVPTPTGVGLIATIRDELLKSAELTGIWERKLRAIERGDYDAATFITELKQMVTDLIAQVRTARTDDHTLPILTPPPSSQTASGIASQRKNQSGEKTKAEKEPLRRKNQADSQKAENTGMSSAGAPAGFRPKKQTAQKKVSTKKAVSKKQSVNTEDVKASYNPDDMIGMPCPICHTGRIIKGNTAYGCSRWREGCTYRMPFDKSKP